MWLIERGKGLVDNPALCGLLNRDVAPLVGVKLGINLVSTCSYCFHIVLVDFEIVLFRSTFLCCLEMRNHLQGTPRHKGELLIHTGSLISSKILNHVLVSCLCRKFRTSYTGLEVLIDLTCANNFFKFYMFTYSSP